MDQPVLAHIQISRARPAPPGVFLPARDVMLKIVESRKRTLAQRHDFFKDFNFARPERLQLPVVIVNDSHRARQPQIYGAARDAQRILRILHSTAQD